MKQIKYLLLLLLLICSSLFSKTLWDENNNIYSTKQPYKKGDTLKVIFNERSLINYQLSISEEANTSAKTRAGQGPSINFLPGLGSGDNFQTSQKSSTKNKGILSKSITVQVTSVQKDGNLQIAGTHSIKINDALEQVAIQGMVNPKIIKNKKYIYSIDIINPQIAYQSQIVKPDIVNSKDYIPTLSTNISMVSGVTHKNVTTKYELSEQKQNELILKYLNKILSVLFKK
ncbi:MAG: flagellar basal body L-ring protein FlgH [Spirochaetes bacterium]|nr:flagellar basal body L-ring protein FlgH [Spirochaetota bacterium]